MVALARGDPQQVPQPACKSIAGSTVQLMVQRRESESVTRCTCFGCDVVVAVRAYDASHA